MSGIKVLDDVISTVTTSTSKPEQFLSVQNAVASNLKNSMKLLYDFTKKQSQRNNNALPELITEDFDEEQIWQQLELQNDAELMRFSGNVSRLLAGNKTFSLSISLTKPASIQSEVQSSDTEESKVDESYAKRSSESEVQLKSSLKKRDDSTKKYKKKSVVDDKFFKLQELDEYLTKEEKKEKYGKDDTDESDDESVDLFNDISEEEDTDTDDAKFLKYADFFDRPQSEEEEDESKAATGLNDNARIDNKDSLCGNESEDSESDQNDEYKPKSKKVKFNLINDSDETDSLENKVQPCDKPAEPKSSFEERQERLQHRIRELEEKAISDKPWQLQGEVTALNRPQNSLLEEYVEFDVATRPAPAITEETTMKLEDIIKQRIKDKAWDDVEKKFKPIETPFEYKKKLTLEHEKSKESLSQIYEKEYLKQKETLNPESKEQEEPKAHTEIREMMHSLFIKLDALSNFHYTPKPINPDIKIISNVPAINMEEVAPLATSDAVLLAPEEIKVKPRGDVIGKSERTSTDMKRERRQKKSRQHEKQKAMEKKEKLKTLKPVIDKKRRQNTDTALLKKLSKQRNIVKLGETNEKVSKSSTAFFTRLQDQVQTHIKSKVDLLSRKKNKDAISAVKLKL